MKRTLLLFVLAILFLRGDNVFAQRYLPKMGGIEILGNYVIPNGFGVDVAYSWYTKKKNRWKLGGHWLHRQYTAQNTPIPLDQYTLEGGYYYMFLADWKKTFFLSVGVMATGGYESINQGRQRLPDGAVLVPRSRWIYGGVVALEAEYYFSDKYIGLFSAKQRILAGSDLNYFNTEISLGLKIIIDFKLHR